MKKNLLFVFASMVFFCTVMCYWKMRIARTGSFFISSMRKRTYPTAVDSWNFIESRIPIIVFLTLIIPPILAWIVGMIL